MTEADLPTSKPLPPPDIEAVRIQVFSTLLRSAGALLAEDRLEESALLTHFCTTLTREVPSISVAWTWFGAADTAEIVPQVLAGSAQAYARSLRIPRNPMTEDGPAFRALSGQRTLPFRVSAESPFGPWREAATQFGIRDVLALPLRSLVDEQRGVFVLYATEDQFFNRMGLAIFEALAELFSAVLSRAARQKARVQAAATDPLTGLHNRLALPWLADRLEHTAGVATLLLLDLDHFKLLNDAHGSAVGDAVLQQVAGALEKGSREGALLARWGGEEFLVALPGATVAQAAAAAERLRTQVADLVHAAPDGQGVRLTVSIGIAALQPGEAMEAAVHRAEQALSSAKRSGRNRVVMA